MSDFHAGIVRGFLITVTPDGWRIRSRARLVAEGREVGAQGVALALAAVPERA